MLISSPLSISEQITFYNRKTYAQQEFCGNVKYILYILKHTQIKKCDFKNIFYNSLIYTILKYLALVAGEKTDLITPFIKNKMINAIILK